MKVRVYQESDAETWDLFIHKSSQSTFLHSRLFLSYHRNRFEDHSVMILDQDDRLLGCMPAARDPKDSTQVVSHPGATFGGLIHQGELMGSMMLKALSQIRTHYQELGFRSWIYKPVPAVYHRQLCEDDLWALSRLQAELIRRDLSSAIDLRNPFEMSDRRKRSLKKAASANLKVIRDVDALHAFWPVLESGLQTRFGIKPVHRLEEIIELKRRFPELIRNYTAMKDDEVVAGLVLFLSPRLWHSQYSVASEEGFKISALDFLLKTAIEEASQNRVDYFDFGISTEEQGQVLNEGLYSYKSEFGGGGFLYDHYRLKV